MFNRLAFVALASLAAFAGACVDQDPSTSAIDQDVGGHGGSDVGPGSGRTTIFTPVGLAIDIEDAAPVPLTVRKNQTFYVNQIDLRAHANTGVDEGIAALFRAGDFANLDWRGTELVDQSFVNLPNADGTFTRRRFYRDARWMNVPTLFLVEQLDARGQVRGVPVVINDGHVDERAPNDMFFARRLRGIQWAYNCASKEDCSTASNFLEEALVELRYTSGPRPTFQFDSHTTQLRILWTANPGHPYIVPVQQVESPEWDYGFGIALDVTTPPRPDGTYQAGQTLDVAFTLTDGSGKNLAPGGHLPTFLDYLTGNDPPGIDYWDVTEPVTTYYRRKHKEKQMIVGIVGPVQDSTTVRETFDLPTAGATSPDGDVIPATPAKQGFYAAAFGVPAWKVLLGVEPIDTPVTNTGTFTLPPDAAPGTYKIVMKGRRSYMGEELPRAAVISIQVGSPVRTSATLDTGGCKHCHNGPDTLPRMNHGFSLDDRDTCTICHVPLTFEPEGPVYVRTHFVHSRSGRLDASPARCNLCHLDRAGIQRTSKSACLSCHKSYPADHVASYGPIRDMYIGGTNGADGNPLGVDGKVGESFQQCTSTCHRNHPSSGL